MADLRMVDRLSVLISGGPKREVRVQAAAKYTWLYMSSIYIHYNINTL